MEFPQGKWQSIDNILAAETIGAERRMLWATILKLIPQKDGNCWCVLYGENLQVGISAFGDTPEKAMVNFDIAMQVNKGDFVG